MSHTADAATEKRTSMRSSRENSQKRDYRRIVRQDLERVLVRQIYVHSAYMRRNSVQGSGRGRLTAHKVRRDLPVLRSV